MYNKGFLQICMPIILFLSCFASKAETQDRCYVLALEGGGDKGAYQAGALKGLVDNDPETKWDVVTGISAGALNAASISIFAVGDEKSAIDFTLNRWRNIKGKGDIYQNWWLGPLEGLFFKTGIYDTTPLDTFLHGIMDNSTLKRSFIIGATSILNGTYHTWDENTLTREEIVNAILSSSAFPVLFPNIEFRGSNYMDGAVKISVDIASGINKCLDKGFTEENITVDVILLNSENLPELTSAVHPVEVFMRTYEIFGYDNAMRCLDEIQEFFPKVNYRYIISPTTKLPSGSVPLTFSPEDIEIMIEAGIRDAKLVVKQGKKINMLHLLSEHKHKRSKFMGTRERRTENGVVSKSLGFLKEF